MRIFIFPAIVAILALAASAPADPATGPWQIPILILHYFPTTPDHQKIDINITSNVDAPLPAIRAKCKQMTQETIDALQQGTGCAASPAQTTA